MSERSEVLIVGDMHIPYEVRESQRATRMRITVTPKGVRVVAPAGAPLDGEDGIRAYVASKRRWVFDAVQEIEERHQKLLTQRWASGAKLQYRGRWLMVDVRSADVQEPDVLCRSKFHVRVPEGLAGVARLETVRDALHGWLRARAVRDVERFGRQYECALEVEPKGYRLSEARTRWGSCGRDGTIRVHWRLAQAPAAAMEYVVLHELAHLLHRNHSDAFWATLASVCPDWEQRKALLESWETEPRAL